MNLNWKRIVRYGLILWLASHAHDFFSVLILKNFKLGPGVDPSWLIMLAIATSIVLAIGVFAALARRQSLNTLAHAWAVWGLAMSISFFTDWMFAIPSAPWLVEGFVLSFALAAGTFIGRRTLRRGPGSNQDWLFADAKNTAAFSVRSIVQGGNPVLRVTHDANDGAWQFLGQETPRARDAMVIGLEEMTRLDPSLMLLADLPLGWQAVRTNLEAPWEREPISSDESETEDASTHAD